MKKKLALLVLAFTSVHLTAQEIKVKRIDSLIHAANANGVFNGNALVAQHGKIVYQFAMGYADGRKTKPLTPDLLFYVGSISKEFNSAGIMLLAEKGKLKLDDKVSHYLPGLPEWADKIQIVHLLQYTSGLPLLNLNTDTGNWNALGNIKKLEFEPGSAYIYSNANIYLQQKIIEKISGMSYADFVSKALLRPLHIAGGFTELPSTNNKIAKAFDNTYAETVYDGKTNSLLLSAGDLYQWCKALHSYQILGKKSVDQLGKSFGNNEGSLGNVTFANGQISEHTHQGSGYNYECLLYYNVTEDLAVILMTNNQNFKVNQIKDAIVAILNDQPFIVPKRSIYIDLRTKVLDDFDKGIAFYEQIKSTQPNQYDFSDEANDLYNTGKYLMRRNRFDDAVKIFDLSTLVDIKNTGGMSYAFSLMGDCYLKKGEKDMAVIYYKKAVELDPTNKNAEGMLREIYNKK
ncbi:MAG TPA: serine hydrolase [Mucilaginibacter sp.]|jgi:CubicO group peptidase (beta-lactamase class C family)|nr:serine hydrolase [Mucilaginibacter sp.]